MWTRNELGYSRNRSLKHYFWFPAEIPYLGVTYFVHPASNFLMLQETWVVWCCTIKLLEPPHTTPALISLRPEQQRTVRYKTGQLWDSSPHCSVCCRADCLRVNISTSFSAILKSILGLKLRLSLVFPCHLTDSALQYAALVSSFFPVCPFVTVSPYMPITYNIRS
jgi:hypothetical protein